MDKDKLIAEEIQRLAEEREDAFKVAVRVKLKNIAQITAAISDHQRVLAKEKAELKALSFEAFDPGIYQ